MMKFTTPATASDPYTAEAPPVTMSTRCISICGSWSTLLSGTRRPLNSNRVRAAPMERRLSELAPEFWLELPGLRVWAGRPANTGSL